MICKYDVIIKNMTNICARVTNQNANCIFSDTFSDIDNVNISHEAIRQEKLSYLSINFQFNRYLKINKTFGFEWYLNLNNKFIEWWIKF